MSAADPKDDHLCVCQLLSIKTTYSLFNRRGMYLYNSLHDDEDKVDRNRMMKNIGGNLRRIRRKKELTQEKISELAGINPKYLGEIERGIKNPTAFVVQRLADALGVPVCEIMQKKCCPYKNEGVIPR